MTATIMSLKTTAIRWADVIEYPQTEVKSNATVNVIEGQGVLTLEGKEIVLELGVFVFLPATASHAIKAVTNLAFLLTLSQAGC